MFLYEYETEKRISLEWYSNNDQKEAKEMNEK